MDEFSGRRLVSTKRSSLLMRDTASSRARKAQLYDKLGCSSKPNSIRSEQNGSPSYRYSRPNLRSCTSGKEKVASSSRSDPSLSSSRNSLLHPQTEQISQVDSDSSEASSCQDETENSEVSPPLGRIQRTLRIGSRRSELNMENARSQNNKYCKYGLDTKHSPNDSSISMASRNVSQATRTSSQYGLRNLNCNSVSDAGPSNRSSLNPNLTRRHMDGNIHTEGESSSSTRGKKFYGQTLKSCNASSQQGTSAFESRSTHSRFSNRVISSAPVRTRRSSSQSNGLTYQRTIRSGLRNESPVLSLQMHHSDSITDGDVSNPSQEFSIEAALSVASARSQSTGTAEGSRTVLSSSLADVSIRNSLMEQEIMQHYSMDGIAAVLLSLERIEQSEELTYEQILALETNLYSLYDQHRDMRLDIDNMSYEELLALEERIGTVSTALPEEALAKCLETEMYQRSFSEDGEAELHRENDDIKCSICQEEYADGDEVGRLHCNHKYHVDCVHQWLRLKNWCPICKGSAEAPSSSSSPSPSPSPSSSMQS